MLYSISQYNFYLHNETHHLFNKSTFIEHLTHICYPVSHIDFSINYPNKYPVIDISAVVLSCHITCKMSVDITFTYLIA